MSHWDSLKDVQTLFQTTYSIDSLYKIKPLSEFDTVISLRLKGGWASFEYFANIYTQSGQNKSELFQYVDTDYCALNDSLIKTRRGYARIKGAKITSDDWKSIFHLLDSCDYWCTNRNANQCHASVDGEQWSLSVKMGNKYHRVFWTNCHFSKSDTGCINRCPEMEIIARHIFYTAGLPRNRYVFILKDQKIENDSVAYWVIAPIFFPEQQVYYKQKPVPNGNLIVSNKDKEWFKYLEIVEPFHGDTNKYIPAQIFWDKNTKR